MRPTSGKYSSYASKRAHHRERDSDQLLLTLYRKHSGRIVATLTKYLGIAHLSLAERLMEDAFLKVGEQWSGKEVPAQKSNDPTRRIWEIVNSLTVQVLSREKNARYRKYVLMMEKEGEWSAPRFFLIEEKRDDRLRMLFCCSHPKLAEEDREILVLSVLCGLRTAEIRESFFTGEGVISKRILGAKENLIALAPPYQIPTGRETQGRLDAALGVLYRIFTKGYYSQWRSTSAQRALCDILIELLRLMVARPELDTPKTHALYSLFLLNTAMLPSSGRLLHELAASTEEERALWDRGLISAGLRHLHASAQGREVSLYHLEAGISACHAIAASSDATDWEKIVSLYDNYLRINDSGKARLNRALALARLKGPREGIDALNELIEGDTPSEPTLVYSTLGDLYTQLGEFKEALNHYGTALKLTRLKHERKGLEKKIDNCLHKLDMTRMYPRGSTL